ncbi:MAG: ABC transporter permease [Bacteroidales bacterium]|jgi:putative ABC transport system permease protein|nr:ABC transporter permease [Bacteroidales bacterium]
MKPIIRNLISVSRRFKLATTLNILGLSIAFASFVIIMIQLDYDYNFDKFHKDYDKIFRVERRSTSSDWKNVVHSRPFAERFMASSPNIIAGTIIGGLPYDFVFHTEINGGRNFYEGRVIMIAPEFTDVFTVDFVEGSDDALNAPDNVIIPLSLSQKLFGKESAIGKQLFVSQDSISVTVGAVFRDFPSNSILENCIYSPIPPETVENWSNASWGMYIRVNDPANVSTMFENFARNFDLSSVVGGHWADDFFLDFTPLADVHYIKGVDFDYTPKSSKQTLIILLSIAIVIIVIAAINFTNFSTAIAPMRIKNINTQLVLGARRKTLRSVILSEAVIFSFLSFLIAILLVYIFNKTPMARLVDGDLSFKANYPILAGTAFIVLLAGFFVGLYPSRYITSFPPALVLNGNFGLSPKGRKLRNTMMGIQFIASFALIIGASFMYLQNQFMQKSPLGYNKDNLLTVDIKTITVSRDALANQLKSYSGIQDVTFGASLLSTSDMYSQTPLTYKEDVLWTQVFWVYHDFLKVMDIEVTEGRDFRRDDFYSSNELLFILNEAARKQYNWELNTITTYGEIIGFMPDIKYASFRSEVRPMAFAAIPDTMIAGRPHLNTAYIKLKAGTNLRDAVSHINTTLYEFDENYISNIRFFDETLQKLYEKELALNSLIILFSLISIFISIVGVFGLVVFDSECRRKEIGIRKVLGASVTNIVIMFNKAYLKTLIVCFVIAAPLAWYAVTRWLENFVFRTPLHWWVYFLAFVFIGIITVCTVTFQNWRAATSNPVDVIKSE